MANNINLYIDGESRNKRLSDSKMDTFYLRSIIREDLTKHLTKRLKSMMALRICHPHLYSFVLLILPVLSSSLYLPELTATTTKPNQKTMTTIIRTTTPTEGPTLPKKLKIIFSDLDGKPIGKIHFSTCFVLFCFVLFVKLAFD